MLLPAAAARYRAERSQVAAFADPSVLPPLLWDKTKLLVSSLSGSSPSWSLWSCEFLVTGMQSTFSEVLYSWYTCTSGTVLD